MLLNYPLSPSVGSNPCQPAKQDGMALEHSSEELKAVGYIDILRAFMCVYIVHTHTDLYIYIYTYIYIYVVYEGHASKDSGTYT